ncbi:hypothetical protein HF669_04695 [Acidithiobacillus thiooxidans]|jgi:hypothetical protein|uniref:hypothetical protein n=1 Tax=Acidithiobacillus TaxID=119977 RepID=UPI0004E26CA8|nr:MULTISPECIES: hypothetical protein [Acidithiobacillus]MBE7565227.1 hypothetical protein [Acidithiobacillus sp. HP-11]MBU2752707.1 hypothetical protein [Acidithiobacillus thiooxidans]MBU2794545.1 hypothetical protein [Acidithiobacillus thiooxidans]MBU2810683.1 hypothetical protein [Acidithiobacillus thiooxidans]MBU2835102.1 hypothetical protein [Acidithiobacillus thiooxidans]
MNTLHRIAVNYKWSILAFSLVSFVPFVGLSQADTLVSGKQIQKEAILFHQQTNLQKMLAGTRNATHQFGIDSKVSDQQLAKVSGKGIPVNLPTIGRNSNDVVLWDELQNRSGGGKTSIEWGAGNNLQTMSMSTNR